MIDLNLSGIDSSYKENNFGLLFYALVRANKPQTVIELGTFMGYSGLFLASGLRDNAVENSHLTMIDLWDNYRYRHCSLATTKENFKKNRLLDLANCAVDFISDDAVKSHSRFADASVDFLHIDISNDGRSLEKCLTYWHNKLKTGSLLILEGGSYERDKIDWMRKYQKIPIRRFLESGWFQRHYEYVVIEPFPSVTIARRTQ